MTHRNLFNAHFLSGLIAALFAVAAASMLGQGL
jgi:hypothetical protein